MASKLECKVVKLDDYRKSSHIAGPARCVDCGYDHVQVAPAGKSPWMECPKCGTMRSTWKYPVVSTEDHYQCDCGNSLFHVTPKEVVCPRCGASRLLP